MNFNFKRNNYTIAIWALGITIAIALIVILIYLLRPRDNAGDEKLPVISDSAALIDDGTSRPVDPLRVEVEDPEADTATVIDLDNREEEIDRDADMKTNAEINMLADNCRRLVSKMGQLRNAGTLDAETFTSLKSQILDIKDRQISLASSLSEGGEAAAETYRKEKEELQGVFTRMDPQ